MKTTFTALLLIAAVAASPRSGKSRPGGNGNGIGGGSGGGRFVTFQSQFNKHYNSNQEFRKREEIWNENMGAIEAQNAAADASGNPGALRLKMNFMGDLTAAEREDFMGLAPGVTAEKEMSLALHGPRHGRHLEAAATAVDHAASGAMGPVKNQGGCGSCVQFAVSSAVEGTLRIQSGAGNTEHFSEQHLMDCTYGDDYYASQMKADLIAKNKELFGKVYGGFGCGGSWMKYTYNFLKEHGAVDVSKRTYTASETLCQHNPADIVAKATNYGQIVDNVDNFKAKVMQQPVTVAINASSNAFSFYSSGVITADQCTNGLNHAVVVVGYTDKDDSTPGPDPEPTQECQVTKWWHTCTDAPASRRLADANGYSNYWKIQNSWGTGWGDNGFVLFDIQEGEGVCGINKVVEWADMAYV